MNNNIPIDLYIAIRRISDQVHPEQIMSEEVPAKYENADPGESFSKFARLVHTLNPDDFDHDMSQKVEAEKRIYRITADKHNIPVDETSPITPEEAAKGKRFKSYCDQKYFFKGERAGQGPIGGPSSISREDIERLKNIDNSDPELNYFDENGKHLYVHHGWCLGDFEAHPTAQDRAIAKQLEHTPLLGTVLPGNSTGFDEIENFLKNAAPVPRIPCLGKPSPNNLAEHMQLLHGYVGTEENHNRDHKNGVYNHTHSSR